MEHGSPLQNLPQERIAQEQNSQPNGLDEPFSSGQTDMYEVTGIFGINSSTTYYVSILL